MFVNVCSLQDEACLDLQDVLSRLIEGPPADSIDIAMQRLHDLGALDAGWQLTALGIHLAALPVDIRYIVHSMNSPVGRCNFHS